MKLLRLGTRGSKLALAQSALVGSALEAPGSVRVEIRVIRTTGDAQRDRPLPEIGGKGLFTLELDRALEQGEIDLAVHSLKDLPARLEPGVLLAAVPEREDPRDVLVGPGSRPVTLAGLSKHARVGTSSVRRGALLKAFRPDLVVESVRGNLDTRLRKLDQGLFDGLVLAGAGLKRLGLARRAGEWLEQTTWLPAPGQGALGVVTRAGDAETMEAVRPLEHALTRAAVECERALLRTLGGGCQLPVGALGLPYDGGLRLWAMAASPDGRRFVRADRTGSRHDPEALGEEVAGVLLDRGAGGLLAGVAEGGALPGTPS